MNLVTKVLATFVYFLKVVKLDGIKNDERNANNHPVCVMDKFNLHISIRNDPRMDNQGLLKF